MLRTNVVFRSHWNPALSAILLMWEPLDMSAMLIQDVEGFRFRASTAVVNNLAATP